MTDQKRTADDGGGHLPMNKDMRKIFSGIAVAGLLSIAWPGWGVTDHGHRYEVYVSISQQETLVLRDHQPFRTMPCSTGVPGTDDATPTGDFIIDESGTKRGTWFYSNAYHEGARYWVGFVGGTYLFHSVPMDKDGNLIAAEAAKLGTPASHGCVRLSVADAYWLYSTIPDGTPLFIRVGGFPAATLPSAAAQRDQIPGWLAAQGAAYRQKYTLSCEIAAIRVSLALMGITASEDQILSTIPRSGDNPEKAFVCDDVNGGRRNPDGSIHWNNYGAHPPVVAGELTRRIALAGADDRFVVQEGKADDAALKAMIEHDPRFLGAIVWVVGHPDPGPAHHTINERGMVFGEHVRFVAPVLSGGQFQIWDPETGKVSRSSDAGAARDLFSYRVVGIFLKPAAPGAGS